MPTPTSLSGVVVFWAIFSGIGWYQTIVLIIKTPAEKINKIQFKMWSMVADFVVIAWFISLFIA